MHQLNGSTIRYAIQNGLPTLSKRKIRGDINSSHLDTSLAQLQKVNDLVTQVYVI